MSRQKVAFYALASSFVRAEIARELRRRRVAPDELPDLLQETLARALAVHPPPRDVGCAALLARAIARHVAFDHLRVRLVRRRFESNVDADEHPDRHDALSTTFDPIDRQRQLALIEQEARRGRLSYRALAIVHAVSEYVPQTEIAKELGVSHQSVRNELWRARRHFQAAWRALERRGRRAPAKI